MYFHTTAMADVNLNYSSTDSINYLPFLEYEESCFQV